MTNFVQRIGSNTVTEDKQISKAILDVCQKLIDSVNAIVGWQLESTTWLKRTLVVRQDATSKFKIKRYRVFQIHQLKTRIRLRLKLIVRKYN